MMALTRTAVIAAILFPVACSERPSYEVHRNVQLTVRNFGGGLVLNEPLSLNASRAGTLRWVQHVGLVGRPAGGVFEQVRMYPDAEDRAEPTIDSSATVRVVELVSNTSTNLQTIQLGLMSAFRGVPRHGCIVPLDPDAPFRDVQYWTAPNDAGGVAILQDWSDQPAAPTRQALWSLLAWGGPFRGVETLMGPFDLKACDGSNTALGTAAMRATIAAVEGLEVAFDDSVHASRRAVDDHEMRERANADVPDACSVPIAEEATTLHDFPGFSIQLPADFTVHDVERTNRRALYWGTEVYRFSAPDGARIEIKGGREALLPHGVGGMVTAHCDKSLSGRSSHIELMNASSGAGRPRLLVNAYLFGSRELELEAEVSSQARQRALLRAINTLRIKSQWGEASADAKARPNRNPPP